VQSLPASQIDATQNDILLKAWLTELVGSDADTTWQVSSCDLKPDHSTPEESWPLCVEFIGRRKGTSAFACSLIWEQLGVRIWPTQKSIASRLPGGGA
jgi:hypothetical protein